LRATQNRIVVYFYHQRPAKKKKATPSHSSKHTLPKSSQNKSKGKEKAFERGYIEIPGTIQDDDVRDGDLSEDDEAMLNEFGDTINFLATLDQKGISRYFAT